MTQISIAMATLNGARFIRQQLDSFSRQTLLPSELVVCDDGSSDSTVDLVNTFAQTAPFPVTLVTNPKRLGYTANFLQAAQKCRGDLVAFSDQDDEWLPEKLELIFDASKRSSAILIAHAVEWMDELGKPTGIVYPIHRRFRRYLRANDFSGHSIVIRKQLLEMTSYSLASDNYKAVAGDAEFGHDVLLLEIATAMDKVLFVPDVLMRWRVYSESNHAWTRRLKPPPRIKASLLDSVYPPGLSEKYARGEQSYRRHSSLLSAILRDLAACGEATSAVSARLSRLMNLMTKRAEVMKLRAMFYAPISRRARVKLMLRGVALGQYANAKKGGVGISNALRDLHAVIFQFPRRAQNSGESQ
jgi:hypothetical protein